jgi:hypothetical protein
VSRCCFARTELPNTALHSLHHAAKFLLYTSGRQLGNILLHILVRFSSFKVCYLVSQWESNEAHENWSDEQHKLITDRNSYYIPTDLFIPNGTSLVLLHADAPWDTPNPHTIEIQDSSRNANSGQLDYILNSKPVVLPSPGTYNLGDKSYDTKEAKITVLGNETSNGNGLLGGLYTPTEDNNGVSHPGSLQYYKEAFNNDGFDILSEYNFTYVTCDYCTGEYWSDNKSGEHTLFIYSTQQPLSDALTKLGQLVKDNVYV